MPTLTVIMLALALVFLVINVIGKMPLWPSVLVLIIAEFIEKYGR